MEYFIKTAPQTGIPYEQAQWRIAHETEDYVIMWLNFSACYVMELKYYFRPTLTTNGPIHAKYKMTHNSGLRVLDGAANGSMSLMAAREWAVRDADKKLKAAAKSILEIQTALVSSKGWAEALTYQPALRG